MFFDYELDHLYDVFTNEVNRLAERYNLDAEDIKEAVYDGKDEIEYVEDGEEYLLGLDELLDLNKRINKLTRD